MKVLWTKFAINSLHDIFTYYKEHVSIRIAQYINISILSCVSQLAQRPLSGSIETSLTELKGNHRYIIRGNYKIIYKIQYKNVYITDIFDTRQDPEKITRSKESDVTLNEPNEKFQSIS